MGITGKSTAWTLLALALMGAAGVSAWADDGGSQCDAGGGGGGDGGAALAQQAYWQAWDHWLTIYQEQQQAIKDAQARVLKERQDRQLYNPPMTVIWSAEPLNALLKDMTTLSQQGAQLPSVYIQPELLQHINLTSGISEGNVSALAGGNQLSWPLSLTDKELQSHRKDIDALMAKLVSGAKTGKLSIDDFRAMDRALVLLDMDLLDRVNSWAPSDYMEAKRFVSNIRATVKVLRQPDAPSYFNKDYAAKGKTVAELVAFMNVNGLQFGPAGQVDQRAYIVFHRAMASCDMAANAQVKADAEKADAEKAAANPGPNPLVNPQPGNPQPGIPQNKSFMPGLPGNPFGK